MLATNNSDVRVCALNLLRTVRGEVPLVRTKGIARGHIDAPSTRTDELRADAAWVLETYEPRLSDEEIDILAGNCAEGDFRLTASVS